MKAHNLAKPWRTRDVYSTCENCAGTKGFSDKRENISRGIVVLQGEKTHIFWSGLFILGSSLFALFTILWYTFVIFDYTPVWRITTPFAFGSAVFLVIGGYMMKTGVKREEPKGKG